MNDQEQATNYVEYSYEKAITNKDKLNRFLYIAGVVVLMILPILIAVFLHVYFIMYIMPLVLIVGVPLAKFFYRYLQNEFRYTVDRSSFKMELIHGKAKPKLLYECDANDMEAVVPATPENREKFKESDYDRVGRCWVSDNSPDLYILSCSYDSKYNGEKFLDMKDKTNHIRIHPEKKDGLSDAKRKAIYVSNDTGAVYFVEKE